MLRFTLLARGIRVRNRLLLQSKYNSKCMKKLTENTTPQLALFAKPTYHMG